MTVNGFLRIVLISCYLGCLLPSISAARPDRIRVVMENNYPPFVFKDNAGNPQGSQIDLWRLWEQKSGIKAEITLMDWAAAQSRLQAGEFDVIDKIAKTEQRSKIYDFSAPFSTIEVPVFFLKDISGITDAASLKGFAIGVQSGDSVIELLNRNGVYNLLQFNNYEEIVLAAKEHKVNVLVMDKAPALYFLHKHGMLSSFKQSAPLNVVSLHRAVKKGNGELLSTVEEGFRLIKPAELKKIETKWYGSSLGDRVPLDSILAGVGVLCLLVLVLFVWNRTLKKAVEKRTIELKRTEDSLRLTNFAVEHAADSVFWITADASIIEVNQAACRLLGYTRDELLKLKVADIDILYNTDVWQQKWEELKAQGSRFFESSQLAKDGRILPVEISANFIRFNDMEYCCAFVRDITERKKSEEERLSMERQLLHSQKLESLGILSGGIAHDFNNLLQAVLGNLDLALMKLPGEASARKNIDQAINASRHAAKLTNMMLAYSGKGNFIIMELNLTELMEENAALLSAAISKTIKLDLQLDHALPPVMADAGQIQQVIMNLITNAAEAIGDDIGSITLSTGVQWFDQGILDGSRLEEKLTAGRYVWMEVSDTGCGMDEETLHKLFDPFFTTKFTGRGLGMSAVLGIIRAHKGAFLVESRPSAGTTVRVLFPIADLPRAEQANTTNVAAESVAAATSAGTILVVDDEEIIRCVCVDLIEELGFETLVAADGEEALRIFREQGHRIVLVLLDQVMPGMDGVAVFQELRRIRPDIKVLLASGYSEQEVSENYKGLGLDGFIQKPFNLSLLAEEVRRVLGG